MRSVLMFISGAVVMWLFVAIFGERPNATDKQCPAKKSSTCSSRPSAANTAFAPPAYAPSGN